ncbi:MAG: DUF6688 domain-containing protein [Christensenellales bacterium]
MKRDFWKRHLILLSIFLAEAPVPIIFLIYALCSGQADGSAVLGEILLGLLVGAFLIYPLILTALNGCFLFGRVRHPALIRAGRRLEWITLLLGALYTALLLAISEIQVSADWGEQLVNSQMHAPIWTGAYPTVLTLWVVGLIGYGVLSAVPLRRLPPLVTVLSISGMYLELGASILWAIQVFSADLPLTWLLCLMPVNILLITAKTIRCKVSQWREQASQTPRAYSNPLLNWIQGCLRRSENWPWLALLLMGPLLGILIAVLALFGQRPDSVVKAWTETSDWNLSRRVAPQNVYHDEHYLCTVAAGGHPAVVKPLRLGVRHGHEVIVNRQLCVANAFEQVLEQRTPRFHRGVRHFYDTYGFPVAKLIRSPLAADLIYCLMKPLEWLFLLALYLTDAQPENRIALQYLPPIPRERTAGRQDAP